MIKRLVNKLLRLIGSNTVVELSVDFNPEEHNWDQIRNFIYAANEDLLRSWLELIKMNGWKLPKPFLDMARRKITYPRSYEFYPAGDALKQIKEFEIVNMEVGKEERLNLLSPPRYKKESPYLLKMDTFTDWQELILWRSDIEFQGIEFSRVGRDLYEWKKDQLFEKER